MNKEQLSELDQCLASFQESAKELKSCFSGQYSQEDMASKMNSLADSMYASMASIRNTMWNLHDSQAKKLNDHMQNHFPAPKSNKHVENFLKACDMSDDYQTTPKDISISSYSNMAYASKISATKNGLKVEVDFNKPKDK